MRIVLFFLAMTICSVQSWSQQVNPVLFERKKTVEVVDEDGKLLQKKENEESTDNDKFFILGVGSTDALQFDKLNASGGVSVCFKPIKRISAYLTYNYGGNVVKNEKSDSTRLNTLYFPDIASSALREASILLY